MEGSFMVVPNPPHFVRSLEDERRHWAPSFVPTDILPGLGLLVKLLPNLFHATSHLHGPTHQELACLSLQSRLHPPENTTINRISYVAGGSTVPLADLCASSTIVDVSVCRVEFVTQTSETSAVRAELWLPDEWHGRFLGLGNSGLSSCMDYAGLNYASTVHFAAIASNGGHDGGTLHFLNRPEVINDFSFRAVHVEAVVGKHIVEAYYQRPHSKSYYLGCSTGGRQGTQAALKYPQDYDGIVAGAPALNFNHLIYWSGITARRLTSANIPLKTWQNLVSPEILKQCDGLDGVMDGIITEPDDCKFDPQVLLCREDNTAHCLTQLQVEVLRELYSPLVVQGRLVCPRLDPGAESDPQSFSLLTGEAPYYTADWLRYAVFNDTEFDLQRLDEAHLRVIDHIDPGGISTFNGDLSAFRNRGGKFITYHGRMDPIVVSGNSKRFHELVSQTMGNPDDFFRLFLIPGMGHCFGGPGATKFGHHGLTPGRNNSEHNILSAIVEWVEGGVAPSSFVGVGDRGQTRRHCLYPRQSVWNGSKFVCR
ncbi:Carboxylic ester hydrolase [Mycena indigotica]|uniref:Carboxylic ester hydrolase n=1 Tax=Mycena indigotica TaxID=2126181 RepID=A0A8H6RZH1_9AGAR|nr:Carboxylic ester hydrolase [Mycena indigotica]KAF7289851.1 Carboxylic ester hydrolase [Mycena indigotica]